MLASRSRFFFSKAGRLGSLGSMLASSIVTPTSWASHTGLLSWSGHLVSCVQWVNATSCCFRISLSVLESMLFGSLNTGFLGGGNVELNATMGRVTICFFSTSGAAGAAADDADADDPRGTSPGSSSSSSPSRAGESAKSSSEESTKTGKSSSSSVC